MKKYIVIGASAAGVACATKLRDLDKESEIIMIGADDKLPCNRCLLSEILSGNKTEKDIVTKDLDYFKQQNIKVMLSTTVTDILTKEKAVTLHNGQKLSYDKLFLGVGKSGFVPNVPGSKLYGVFSFYGLPDVTAINDFIEENRVKNVVVIGAGLTGLECCDVLASKGLNVSLIKRSSHVLTHQIDDAGAKFIENLMKNNGVTLYSKEVVKQIIGTDGKVSGIILSEHGEIPADLLIFAIGGKTNLELALHTKLDTTPSGIIVKNTMQTSNADIFAGGDCCMVNNLLTGQPVQSSLWPDAVMQGITAAHSMIGIKREYPGTLIITSSNIFGTQFVTCGPVNQLNKNYEEVIKNGPNFYHKFLIQNGTLKGFIMVGNVENVGVLRKKLIDKTSFQP